MRKGKLHILKYYLVVIILLISGMYFEGFEIDSPLLCDFCASNAPVITSGDSISASLEYCTPEMLNHHGEIKASRHTNEKHSSRTGLFLSLIESLSLALLLSASQRDTFCCPEISGNHFIIRYIHQKDGKKS